MNFPTCRTCVHLCTEFLDVRKEVATCKEQTALVVQQSYIRMVLINPDQFFCSKHETKYGEKFVNWENK